jgi:hypothetical protein
MDAAARIEIGSFSRCWKFGPVGVAADDHNIPLRIPFIIALFDLVAFAPVFCGTSRIFHTNDMKEFPYVPDQDIGYSPQLIVDQVSLMTMYNEDLLFCVPVGKKQGLMDNQVGEQILSYIKVLIIGVVQVLLDIFLIPELHVVIAEQHNQTLRFMEALQKFKNGDMGGADMLIIRVFPKLIPIANLHIGKVILIVIIQSMIVNMAIPAKFIGQTVVPPVNISKEYIFGAIVERDRKCLFIYGVQS